MNYLDSYVGFVDEVILVDTGSTDKSIELSEKAGVKVAGTLPELLEIADIVIDCTPKKANYKPLYEKHNVKAIWQGGEKHDLTGLYSRRINKKHRLVYSINEEVITVHVLSAWAHYGDR